VTIGDKSVIGAGSVVAHDVPAANVVVGNPRALFALLTPNVNLTFIAWF
jgi:serine acetyltransferase